MKNAQRLLTLDFDKGESGLASLQELCKVHVLATYQSKKLDRVLRSAFIEKLLTEGVIARGHENVTGGRRAEHISPAKIQDWLGELPVGDQLSEIRKNWATDEKSGTKYNLWGDTDDKQVRLDDQLRRNMERVKYGDKEVTYATSEVKNATA